MLNRKTEQLSKGVPRNRLASMESSHTTNHNNFQTARNIKESIYIRVNNPSLNNNIGKFNLSHIWDRVLLNTKGLTLK